jgi:hypothetical protein
MDASKQVQRGIIQFLCKEGASPSDILRRMKDVYGDTCLKQSTVFKWYVEFRGGQVSTADRPRPGQVSVITEEKIAAVGTLVQENRRITVRELSTAVNISMGSIHQILHAHLGYQSLCPMGAQAPHQRTKKPLDGDLHGSSLLIPDGRGRFLGADCDWG